MKFKFRHNGFSLTEVLMAVGILSMGMMLIATMFPVGIYLTTVAVERTMAAIVYDEALAKIKLYGIGSSPPPGIGDYNAIAGLAINSSEFSYPSVDPCSTQTSQYYWSALYRKLSANPADTDYYITIFVARKTGPNHKYPDPANFTNPPIDTPRLISIQVNAIQNSDILVVNNSGNARYINPPIAIVENTTGKIYHVIDRSEIAGPPVQSIVKLERPWQDSNGVYIIWLIPPPEAGGKNAGVEVYPAGIVTF